MQITQVVDNNALLDYSLLTSPNPLQVTPQSGSPSLGQLTFVVSCPPPSPPPNGYDQVTVTQITFNLPVGDPNAPDASDLTEVSTGIQASVSSSASDQWQIGPGAAAGSFVLNPKGGGTAVISSQGLTVTLTGIQVSPIVGTAELGIVEVATADSTPAQTRNCTIAVPKFPYGFYAGNFTASAPMVQDGATVVLSWVGSGQGTSYTLLWGTHSQNVSSVNQWASPALTDTTTFILEVSAQEGGETVKLYFSITVIVADPNFVANTLQVLQTAALQGNVAVGTTGVNANLNVNGLATASSVAAGSLNVSGTSNLTSLGVTGATQLAATTIAGALNATGPFAALGAAQPIGAGTYLANTDGFVIGMVGPPSNSGSVSIAWIAGATPGIYCQATGGNVCFMYRESGSHRNWWWGSNPNGFTMPVQKGASYNVSVVYSTVNELNPPVAFYWIPLGSNNARSIVKLSAETPTTIEHQVSMSTATSRDSYTHGPSIDKLVGVLSEIFGQSLSEGQKTRLHEAIKDLVYHEGRTVFENSER